jgi:hypothetical protein
MTDTGSLHQFLRWGLSLIGLMGMATLGFFAWQSFYPVSAAPGWSVQTVHTDVPKAASLMPMPDGSLMISQELNDAKGSIAAYSLAEHPARRGLSNMPVQVWTGMFDHPLRAARSASEYAAMLPFASLSSWLIISEPSGIGISEAALGTSVCTVLNAPARRCADGIEALPGEKAQGCHTHQADQT